MLMKNFQWALPTRRGQLSLIRVRIPFLPFRMAEDCRRYHKTVEVLSIADLYLCAVLSDEEALFEGLYYTAVQEEKRRQVAYEER